MPKHSYSFEAIGTEWQIETDVNLDQALKDKIRRVIDTFDVVYSRFRSDSLVRTIDKEGEGNYTFPESIIELLDWYRKLYDATDGKVTPLVGTSLESLGYDSLYSLQSKGFTPAPLWDDIISLEGSILQVSQPVTLDIGATGKGYLVDCIAKILTSEHIEPYVIDASGDMYISKSNQTIGLENPFDTSKVLGATHINNGALCASASNRGRWGDDFHHIVDPRTGRPVNDVVATWVIAPTAMIADGIATALFFTPQQQLNDIAKFSYAILFNDGTMNYSSDNKWEIFA